MKTHLCLNYWASGTTFNNNMIMIDFTLVIFGMRLIRAH